MLGAARAARPGRRPPAVRRPARLGKTTLAGIVAAEMDVGLRITSGPALERAGDLAAILTNLDDGDVLFIDEIHRLPRAGRGGALPGDGGLPARHRDRQGPVGALDPPRPARASRSSAPPPAPGSSPARCATASASSPGSTTTSPTTSSRSSSAPRGILGVPLEPRRRRRDRPPGPRHAPHRQPAAEARARLRRGARRRRGHRRRSPATRSRCSRSTSSASTRSTAPSSRALCDTFAGQPVGLSTLAVAVAEEPETVEDVYEPFLLKAGCSSARHAAGWRRPAPTPTSHLPAPRRCRPTCSPPTTEPPTTEPRR